MPHTPPAPSAPVRRPRSDAVVVISSDDEDQCDRSNSEHSSPLDCIVLGSSCTRQRITDSTSAAAPLPAPLPCSGMYLTTVQVRCCSPPQHSFPSPLCRHNCVRIFFHRLMPCMPPHSSTWHPQGFAPSPSSCACLPHLLHYTQLLQPIARRGPRCKM